VQRAPNPAGKGTDLLTKLSQLFVASVLVSGTVLAQPAGPGTAPAAGGAGEVDISVRQKPTLTPEETLNQAKQYQEGMNQVLKRILALQEAARRQKDIIKLNCVADKLVQTRVNLNIADQAMTALQENITRADYGGRAHEFTRLTIINQKVLVLGAEAENCIGEDLSFVGATRVDVDVDPSIPRDDPTQPPFPVVDVDRPPPDRPPVSSPSA
jgi:hypothetical protein